MKILSLIQALRFFTHIGVRSLLILYMVKEGGFSEPHAIGLNALFLCLLEVGAMAGGMVADRYWGLQRSVVWGAWILGFSYLSLLIQDDLSLSMGGIIVGTSLFSGNITALLGEVYRGKEERERTKGFTFFYRMQNLGALVSALLCAFVAEHFGFRTAFGVACLGIVAACTLLLSMKRAFSQTVPVRRGFLKGGGLVLSLFGLSLFMIYHEGLFLPLLPWMTGGVFAFFSWRLLQDKRVPRGEGRQFLFYLGALILFFAAEDQICSSLLLFVEEETTSLLWGWKIPSSLLVSLNPIVILLLGGMVAKKRPQLLTPFLLIAFSFGLFWLFNVLPWDLSLWGVMGGVMVLSFAELMVGPLVLSVASTIATQGERPGCVMAMVPLAFSMAFLLSGTFGKLLTAGSYNTGFGQIALLLLIGGYLLHLGTKNTRVFNSLQP